MKRNYSANPTKAIFLTAAFVSILASCTDTRLREYSTPTLDFTTTINNGFVVPKDWEVKLWAESPDLFNPTNMDVDAKGRVWVTEAVNYRNFNNSSETHLNFEGGDRIVILEDTDGDGVSDSSKVFVQDEDLVAPMGIAVIGNRIFVSSAPNLLVYTDEDGDDVPDKKEVFLTGFGGLDHDHSLHSLIVGPDGKYYFNAGNAGPHLVTDRSGWTLRSGSVYTGGSPHNLKNEPAQVSDDGRVWVGGLALRTNKDGGELEVMGHNFRNSYEVALDSYGTMWQNDNDDQVVTCRVSYVMEGGNAGYFSANGKRTWQADQRPGQEIFTSHWHQEDPGVMPAGDNTGAGSPTGVVVYEGDAFGAEFEGMLLSADAGRNVIFAYQPSQNGAGFHLNRKDLITSTQESTEDYVWNDVDSDNRKWFRPSDVTVGTDGAIYIADWYDPVVGGHQMMDTLAYGRIYRITPRGKVLKTPKIDLSTIKGQIKALLNPAINVRNLGFEKLKSQGTAVIGEVKKVLESPRSLHQARAVWLLSNLGELGILEVESILKYHPDPRLRVTAYRALKNNEGDILKYAQWAVDDPAPEVRREVAISLRDVAWLKSGSLIQKLYEGYNGTDLWYLEALGTAMEGKEEESYAALLEGQEKDYAQWSDTFANVVWRIRPKTAIEALKARATEISLSVKQRKQAIDALAFIQDEDAVAAMIEIQEVSDSDIIKEWADWWLDFRKTNDWFSLWSWKPEDGVASELPQAIDSLRTVLENNNNVKDKVGAAKALSQDLVGARILMAMAHNGELDQELLPEIAKTIFDNPYLEVRTLAKVYFKQSTSREVSLVKSIALKGVPADGKNLFMAKCASCHKSPEGGNDIGPDLSQIGNKFDKTAMLQALIEPSASIVFGYEPLMVKLRNGLVFYGFLLSEGETMVLKDVLGNKIILDPNDVIEKTRLQLSLMPDAFTLGLKEQELSDLSSYLLTLK
ncbi:PVC-type heme-binding CxxCH protein [Maribacter chungangensis]|uniref:PVC-type heme-binding CxxCH protein n=1 Tax=Maribacter chungangensis TaxID=1069117 RepID=A0ABW3AYZ3_9FLAO